MGWGPLEIPKSPRQPKPGPLGTCESAASTLTLLVEIKMSTSAIGWVSPSGACVESSGTRGFMAIQDTTPCSPSNSTLAHLDSVHSLLCLRHACAGRRVALRQQLGGAQIFGRKDDTVHELLMSTGTWNCG